MMAAGRAQRVGYAVDGVAMLQTDARYVVNTPADQPRLLEQFLTRVTAIPGVQAATLTRDLPMNVGGRADRDRRSGGPRRARHAEPPASGPAPASSRRSRSRSCIGRALDARDREGALLAAVVNEGMARRYFGTVNAIGRRFRIEPGDGQWMTVVGVARDTWTNDLGDIVDPVPYLFYRPIEQWNVTPTTVVARTTLGEAPLVRAMQVEMRRVNERLPVLTAKTMRQVLEDSLQVAQGMAAFFTGLGLLGLTLAGIGLYAVIAFAVARRSREIGIRMALGAGSQQVVWSVAREVAALVGVGTAVGLALWLVAVLVMRVAPVQTSGVANIQFYQPDVDPLAMADDCRVHGARRPRGGLRAGTARGPHGSAGRAPALLGRTWGPARAGPGPPEGGPYDGRTESERTRMPSHARPLGPVSISRREDSMTRCASVLGDLRHDARPALRAVTFARPARGRRITRRDGCGQPADG